VKAVTQGPHYWRQETSGVLAPAVERFLNHRPLSPDDIAALRAYIRQWICNPVWDGCPYGTAGLDGLRDMVDSLNTRKQIAQWTWRALDLGIDPW
jgi:hypothetical protein